MELLFLVQRFMNLPGNHKLSEIWIFTVAPILTCLSKASHVCPTQNHIVVIQILATFHCKIIKFC